MSIKYSEILASDEVLTAGNDDIIILAIVDGGSPTGYTTKAIKTSNYIAGGGVATDVIWDANLDLAVGTGSDTAVRLAGGSALQVLRVNAGATALEWAAPSGADGNGIYDGSGSLSGTTTVTMGSNQLTFSGTQTNFNVHSTLKF